MKNMPNLRYSSPRLAACLTLAWLISSCGQPAADLVLLNGRIYTLTPGPDSVVAALACKDGLIVALGGATAVKPWIGKKTQVLDLKGQFATPGLVEGHAHLLGLGKFQRELDLTQAESYREVVEAVQEAAKKAPPGTWILGRGWHQSKWKRTYGDTVRGFPVHDSLSAVSVDHPVYLAHASGHAALANQMAMRLAGLEGNAFPDEAMLGKQGEVVRNRWGEPTGIFNEKAAAIISRHIPPPSEADLAADLDAAVKACLEWGITSFHDAGANRDGLAMMQRAHNQGLLPIRLYVMLAGSDSSLTAEWFRRGPLLDPMLTVRSVKWYVDGALGSRGAWLLQPYSDQPGHVGHPVTPVPYLRRQMLAAYQAGFQVCAHAIGDLANRATLDLYQEVFLSDPDRAADARFRVEHAQHIDPADLPRFAALNVIASVQGIHHASDRPWAIRRLGQARIESGAYPWQRLLQSGAWVINGTDAPVEPLNPFECLYASVSRKTLQGLPEGGYEPAQAMTRLQALQSYTSSPAYGAFQEKEKGRLAKGYWADITVWSDDFFAVPEQDIRKLKAKATIVAGQLRWQAPE